MKRWSAACRVKIFANYFTRILHTEPYYQDYSLHDYAIVTVLPAVQRAAKARPVKPEKPTNWVISFFFRHQRRAVVGRQAENP